MICFLSFVDVLGQLVVFSFLLPQVFGGLMDAQARKLFKDRYDSFIHILLEDEHFYYGMMYTRGRAIDLSIKKFSKLLHNYEEYDEQKYRDACWGVIPYKDRFFGDCITYW